jgi:hypothetical protein
MLKCVQANLSLHGDVRTDFYWYVSTQRVGCVEGEATGRNDVSTCIIVN